MLSNDGGVLRARSSVFVGRAAELTELIDAVDRADAGTPSVTVVSGDAGTGKTRLLQELMHRVGAAGGRLLSGSCVPVGDFGVPYLPIIDALRALEIDEVGAAVLREEAAVRPALARLLPQLTELVRDARSLESDTRPGQEGMVQGQVFEGLLRVLTALSTKSPVLLVIEDVHWADRSTRELIAFLTRALRAGRVAVVVSYRSDDLHRRHPLRPLLAELARLPHVGRVALQPFTRTELAQLLDDLTGSPVDVQVVDKVFARSQGNAFFAEELMAAKLDAAQFNGAKLSAPGGDSDSAGRLPHELADLLLNRVEQLSAAGRHVVRAAAVAGLRVRHDLLTAAAGTGETIESLGYGIDVSSIDLPGDRTAGAQDMGRGLRDAVESGLLTVEADTYAFRHALFQEAVYADLLPGERVQLHARYAKFLGERPDLGDGPGELAYHLLASHDLAGALTASVEAATQAEQMAAPSEALQYLEQALRLLPRLGSGPGELDLLIRAADAAAAAGDVSRALSLGRAAVSTADRCGAPLQQRAAVRERLARLEFDAEIGNDEPSRQAVELLAGQESPLLARALATRARTIVRSDPEGASLMLAEATRIACAVGDDVIAADASVTLNMLARRGFPMAAVAPSFDDILARTTGAKGLGVRLRALRFQAAQLMEDGHPEAALGAADQGVSLTREAGLSWSAYGLDLRLMRGWALTAVGRWDEVLAESLAAVYAATPPGRVLATQAVAVLVGRGDPEAEPLLTRLRGTGDHVAELQLDLCEMDLYLAQGRPEDAITLAETCWARLHADGWETERLLLAARHAAALADLAARIRAAGQSGAAGAHEAAARELADRVEKSSASPALNGHYGRSWRLRLGAEAARVAAADTAAQWEEVLAESRLAGRVPEQIYPAIRAAGLLLERGDRDRAADLLRPALEVASSLRAGPSIEAITSMAGRARLSLSAGRAPRRPVSVLTAREFEVLALVAQGMSNRRIGQTLFISEKTAGVHLSHILGKLGAASRTEAVSLAMQRGLLEVGH